MNVQDVERRWEVRVSDAPRGPRPGQIWSPCPQLNLENAAWAFPAHSSAPLGVEPFSTPRTTRSELGRPLRGNPEPHCPGPPEHHSTSERWATPAGLSPPPRQKPCRAHLTSALTWPPAISTLASLTIMHCVDSSPRQGHDPSPMPVCDRCPGFSDQKLK